MSTVVQIGLTPEANRIVAAWKSLPGRIGKEIALTIDAENLLTVSHIQRQYLSAPKDGPTSLDYLRARGTPGMRGSLRATKAVVQGNEIISAIGTNMKRKGFSYPSLHEFGGSWTMKAGSVRLRTDAKGNLLGQKANNRLAVFAKSSHKRAVVRTFEGGGTVVMPARALLRRGIADRAKEIRDAVSNKIVSLQP